MSDDKKLETDESGDSAAVESSEPESSKSPPAKARSPIPRGWRLGVQLLLPVVLCAGAIGAHWRLNVPDEIQISPRDQGAKKKAKKKAKKRKRKAKRARNEPRTDKALDRAWDRWKADEIDDEPIVVGWGRRHQSLVRKAFLVARTHAFEGAPEEPTVTLALSKCHTIRCRFLLRSAFAHENDATNAALSKLESDGAPLWRHYDAKRIDAPDKQPEDQDYIEVIVAFSADDIAHKTIAVPGAEVVAGPDAKRGTASKSGAADSAGGKPAGKRSGRHPGAAIEG
ncbi:MAG: hypothetical protein JKY37_32260 [Nannocystaceae bacterium]|nr:hypothetical protein [Nannocystaceae bacterium]